MALYQTVKRMLVAAPNAVVGLVIGSLGKSPAGAQLLEVRGRASGNVRTVPVNPVEVDGNRFLVAPRGETQWVKNFRASGEGALRVGDRRERIVGRELADEDKPEILRAYLDRWYWQVSGQFDVPKDASLEQLAAIAHNHPVFHIHNREIA